MLFDVVDVEFFLSLVGGCVGFLKDVVFECDVDVLYFGIEEKVY